MPPIRTLFIAFCALPLSAFSLAACSSDITRQQDTAQHSSVAPAETVLTGPMSRPVLGDGGVSDFYLFKGDLPDAPGVLLRQEPLQPHQSVPGAATNTRLLYTSTDGVDGETRITVSGSLFLPEGDAPQGGWPLVLWSHGTVGISDRCAPTWTGYREFHQVYLKQWLDQGYAIVASDYQGLGTPGTHPYLATRPASYNNLDIIRAVQSANFPIADKTVLIGQSQGAAAAFATAGHAPDYAPELDLRGVVATGIPYFTPKALEALDKYRPRDVVDPMLGYNFLAITLIEQIDPAFDYTDYISDAAMPSFIEAQTACYQEMKPIIAARELTYNQSFTTPISEPLKIAFDKMGYPRMNLPVPAYIGSGADDKDTPLRMQAGLVKAACADGSRIQAHVYDGFDHLTALTPSTRDSIPFVRAAFAGEEIAGNCAMLPYDQ